MWRRATGAARNARRIRRRSSFCQRHRSAVRRTPLPRHTRARAAALGAFDRAMAYPKKLSAYMAYSNANRDDVKRELIASGVEKPSIAEIARAISLKWNAMSDEVKAVRERRVLARATRRAVVGTRARTRRTTTRCAGSTGGLKI